MNKDVLLNEISDYCRRAGMAETTFGRLAVNDGKLASRLREGGRITVDTLERVRRFMSDHRPEPGDEVLRGPYARSAARLDASIAKALVNGGEKTMALPALAAAPPEGGESGKHFRFFDNRQKYLLFVNTCSEKWVIAQRVARELSNLHPHPPAVRMFDAGVGDGTVLTRVMRSLHQRFATKPLYVVGKEISLEDVRLALDKMPDRFYEHPATCLVMTNLLYSEAPWLSPSNVASAASMIWHEVALTGTTSHDFEEQITALQPFLSQNWRAKSGKAGNPVYERPIALVIYREDHRFLLDSIIPKRGLGRADYDLIIASQPYRAKSSAEFKARNVIAPLARALAPGGRLVAMHSCGHDPGLEIIQKIWPDENPFRTNRHDILKATKQALGASAHHYNFNAYADAQAMFRYDMHTLPNEINSAIGTSTLFAAWNAAIYVAQIEDQRLEDVVKTDAYLEATREVLQKYEGLWFYDESYVISRKRP